MTAVIEPTNTCGGAGESAPIYPTAHEIAIAIVTAARLTGESPIALATKRGLGGRWTAIAALLDAFPSVPASKIAIWCGVEAKNSEHAERDLHDLIKTSLWHCGHLQVVKSELADAIAETDAAINGSVNAIIAGPAPTDKVSEPEPRKATPSAAALALASFQRARNDRKPVTPLDERIGDARSGKIPSAISSTAFLLGDPAPGRSALDQRGSP